MLLPSALFDLKTHKMRLRTPDPTSGAYSVPPETPSWFRAGRLRQEREWRGEQGRKGGKGKGREEEAGVPLLLFYNWTTEGIEGHQVHSDTTRWPQTR